MKNIKGIILAGGQATRLKPITNVISKQLLPLYDKPMIYYPISTLMQSGIKEIVIITNEEYLDNFYNLLKDGSQWGIFIDYKVQKEPNGLAEAYLIAESFIKGYPTALILGDNLFHGDKLLSIFESKEGLKSGATIFAHQVKDPERYGVVNLNKEGMVLDIEEKPINPKSNFAMTGLYLCDETVLEKAKKVTFSERGELEITDIINMYLKEKSLNVEFLGRGNTWLDTGTYDSLHDASVYIRTLENRQGIKVGCPEEIAWRKEWITDENLKFLAKQYNKSGYGDYLLNIMKK